MGQRALALGGPFSFIALPGSERPSTAIPDFHPGWRSNTLLVMLTFALITLLITFAGGCLPLVREWSHRQLHAVLALATGVFLGAVFLHMLPEISANESGQGAISPRTLWLLTLLATLA